MWGNRLGWGISAAMAVLVLGSWLGLESQLRITAPTSFSSAENLAALAPPLPAQPIVQFNEPGDPGQLYRQAAAAFSDNSEAAEDFARHPDSEAPPDVTMVVDATHQRGVVVFGDDPGRIINYTEHNPSLDALNDLGHLIDAAALMSFRQKKPNDARKFYGAVYSLGLRLYDERLDYEEYAVGMGLMNEATVGLAECEPADSSLRGDLQNQETAVAAFDQERVRPIYQVLVGADPQSIAANAGDIFVFAMQCKDRMLRVEAILKLGRYQFDAARRADQVAVPRYLRKLVNDPDPAIRAATEAARGLTLEQYHMIH
jgi:hypothetical protein